MAVILLVWGIGLNYCPNSPCDYQGADPEYVYQVPLGRGPNTTSTFNEADREGHEDYYARQDLRAQESMARATNAIVLWGALSFIVGTVGMFSLLYAVKLQRENNEISDRISRHELRAYLIIAGAQIGTKADGRLCAAFCVRNVGHTIASEVERRVGQYVGPVKRDHDMGDLPPSVEPMPNIGPQQENHYSFDITPEMISTHADHSGGATQIRYAGALHYRDAFGEARVTGFSFRTNVDERIDQPGVLHQSTTGNYST